MHTLRRYFSINPHTTVLCVMLQCAVGVGLARWSFLADSPFGALVALVACASLLMGLPQAESRAAATLTAAEKLKLERTLIIAGGAFALVGIAASALAAFILGPAQIESRWWVFAAAAPAVIVVGAVYFARASAEWGKPPR